MGSVRSTPESVFEVSSQHLIEQIRKQESEIQICILLEYLFPMGYPMPKE
jgi:hypothetical protein